MLEKIINNIRSDFKVTILDTAVHELSHAIYGVMNDYKIKKINFTEQIVNDKKIDGNVDIDLSDDFDLIKNLCSTSYTESFGDQDKYRKIGKFYIELLLIGYVAEEIYLGKKMDFNSNSIQFFPTPELTFLNTEDGKRCHLILANNNAHNLGMSRMINNYYSNVLIIIQNENFKTILEKLLKKAFYYNFGFFKFKKCKPKIRCMGFLYKLLKKHKIEKLV